MESQLVDDYTTKPLKILLVDDNKSTIKMLSKYFQTFQERYHVGVANTGYQALDYYLKFKPDIVILDISMPGIDGIETLTRLFRIDKDANVIMSSATDSQRTIEICLQKGALGYITKPFTPDELFNSIKNALSGGIYKRDLMMFFSRAAIKVERSFHKMVDNNAIITLDDVNIHSHNSKTFTEPVSTIRNISQIKEEGRVDIAPDCTGFSTEIGGQLGGTIVSVIKKADLNILFHDANPEDKDDDTVLEFFNIININVMSQLADSMSVKLDALPVRQYIKDLDNMAKEKDLTKAEFTVSLKEKKIQLNIYLWLNMTRLFQRLF